MDKKVVAVVFSKVKLTSISLLLTPFVCFSSFANSLTTSGLEVKERIPTEELVEGIKSSDGRWFEVEMIIFERNDNQDIREQFSDEVIPLVQRNQWDLIREALQPDISLPLSKLSQCHQKQNPLQKISQELEPVLFTDALITDPMITETMTSTQVTMFYILTTVSIGDDSVLFSEVRDTLSMAVIKKERREIREAEG